MRRIMTLLVALVLIVSACGSNDDSSDDSASPDTDGDSTVVDDSDDGDDSPAPGASSDFCQYSNSVEDKLDGFAAEIQLALTSGDTSAIEAYFDETREVMGEAASRAPAEIRSDVELLVDGFNQMTELFAEYDYDFTAIPEDAEAFNRLDSAEYEAAGDRVAEFCGIDDDDDDETGFPTDTTGDFDDDVLDDEALIAQGLAISLGIDIELAECLVGELGIAGDTIDPSLFADPTAEVCGTTMGEILAGS